jgi:transposase-like protein
LVYTAPTEETAFITLDKLDENWGKKYSLSLRTGDRTGLTSLHFLSIPMKLEKSFTLPMQLRLCISSLGRLQNREAFSPMMMH